MKKLLALLLALLMALSLCACGASDDQPEQADFSADEWAAVWATVYVRNYLLDNLKKPSSLEINSIRGAGPQDECYYFEIDYTAENGLGGPVRDQLYIAIEEGASAEGGSCLSVGSSTFDGRENQSYTRERYSDIASGKTSYDVERMVSEAEKYILD